MADNTAPAPGGGLGSEASFFVERETVFGDVRALIKTSDAAEASACGARIATILDRYQEQPHLLDPSMPMIVGPLMQKCRELLRLSVEKEDADRSERVFPLQVQQGAAYLQCLFAVVYRCCKVRGYKSILRHFPHEVADLEPVFNCLLSQVCCGG
jgi:tubulin-specific chaperone D